MIFEQIEVKGLAHFSYIVGCEQAKKLVVVDPKRDVDTYLEFAQKYHCTISIVTETHIHADYASGAKELAERTGAELCLSAYDKGERYEVQYPHRELRDGDILNIGNLMLEVMHTPGHTPEHISFLVTDGSNPEAKLFLSGDFLFLGSVGRPDLLGDEETMQLTKRLYSSVKSILQKLDDRTLIYPAHGAGSLCGAGMKAATSGTFVAEKMSNPFLSDRLNEEEFIAKLLSVLPPLPPYYPLMKVLNAKGPPSVERFPGLQKLSLPEFESRHASGATIIDARTPELFMKSHIEKSLNIGWGAGFSTWAGWVAPYTTPLLLVVPDGVEIAEITRALVRVGLDSVQGYLDGGMSTWQQAGKPLSSGKSITAQELAVMIEHGRAVQVLDVRNDNEWKAGHIAGAIHIMAGQIEKHMNCLPKNGAPIAVMCASGFRAAIATSVLERHGLSDLLFVSDGMAGWTTGGFPVVTG